MEQIILEKEYDFLQGMSNPQKLRRIWNSSLWLCAYWLLMAVSEILIQKLATEMEDQKYIGLLEIE